MSRPIHPLTTHEKFCLDAYIENGDAVTAYRFSHKSKSGNPESLNKMAYRWVRSPKAQGYIFERLRDDMMEHWERISQNIQLLDERVKAVKKILSDI